MTQAAPLMFHKDVYIPDFAKVALHTGPLSYSRHALNASGEGAALAAIDLPTHLDVKTATLVEVELNPVTGAVEKQVWRVPLDDKNDLCFPLLPTGFVKTVWLNARADQHATLRRTRYVGGAQWRGMRNKLAGASPAPRAQ